MNRKTSIVGIIILLIISSCNSITHRSKVQKQLPELGTIGQFEEYVLQNINEAKTVVELNSAIRLSYQIIKVSKREIFLKNDSLREPLKDSTLIALTILDKLSLMQQINKNKELVRYLKKGDKHRIITEVTLNYSKDILSEMQSADELYLVQNKQKTLSIELRNNNKFYKTIDFAEGTIVDVHASAFCWGASNGYKIEILDLVNVDSNCSSKTYKSARKAERKTEIRF